MIELIQVTAQYSNAVLLAIIPQISDFATKLDLPVPRPITVEHVREFRCSPMKQDIGGLMILTNDLRVWYHLGHVSGFRTPRSYYNLQDPRSIPQFFGSLKLNKNEAIQLARDRIRKLGYSLKETFTDQEPEVEMPPQIGTNIVPHYQIRWKDPMFGRTAVRIEVNADRKTVEEMRLLSLYFRREPPKIAIEPKVANSRSPVSASNSNDCMSATLPKISEFAKRLNLPLKLPVRQAQVEGVQFVNFDSDVRVKLRNGYWFVSQNGIVTEFSAPDTVYGRQPPALDPFLRPLEEYLGKWKMDEKDAIALLRQAIKKLGYTLEDFHADREPDVSRPDQVGKYIVPRYSFRWLTNDPKTGGTITLVRGEVDANRRRLTWLQLVGKPVAGESRAPRIVPESHAPESSRTRILQMMLGTNVLAELPTDDILGRKTNSSPNQPLQPKLVNPYE